ncbi:MAG: hypothetical protein V7K92_09380 [Nostoc sp.]
MVKQSGEPGANSGFPDLFTPASFMPLNPSTAVAPHERLHQAEGIERNQCLLCETLRERSGTKSGYLDSDSAALAKR